jgi:hypothetical protein
MSSTPVHAIPVRILRHWTIDSLEFVGGAQRPAPALAYSEHADGSQADRLASKLTRVKSELEHRAS